MPKTRAVSRRKKQRGLLLRALLWNVMLYYLKAINQCSPEERQRVAYKSLSILCDERDKRHETDPDLAFYARVILLRETEEFRDAIVAELIELGYWKPHPLIVVKNRYSKLIIKMLGEHFGDPSRIIVEYLLFDVFEVI